MDGRAIAYLIGGMIFGIILFIGGFKWFKKKQLIENIPTSKIRSIAMGLVEIFGEVVPTKGVLLKSPFSNKNCVYYKYVIEEHKKQGKSSRWVKILEDEKHLNFFIKDETGRVLINPRGAKLDINRDNSFDSGFNKDPNETVMRFLKDHSLKHEGFMGWNKQMRYREYFIEPNDKIYVLGTAGKNPHVTSAQKNEEGIMIQKHESNMFYISDKSEKELMKHLKTKIIIGFFGGGVLIVGCLFMLLLYLGVY